MSINEQRVSEALATSAGCKFNFDVEMETGKTYCYVKTIFEVNKRYGWSKFIVMVPSIAIREGVHKSLEITAEHFTRRRGIAGPPVDSSACEP